MEEIWKDVSGFEGLYQVSNLGRVKSVERIIEYSNGKKHKYKEKIVKVSHDQDGYTHFNFSKGNKRKTISIHQLVARHFIENPNCYSEINHKNEIRDDNRACNLEWCDSIYNANYGGKNKKARQNEISMLHTRSINMFSIDGAFIKRYNSLSELRKKGFSTRHIHECCKHKRKTCNGYKFEYTNEIFISQNKYVKIFKDNFVVAEFESISKAIKAFKEIPESIFRRISRGVRGNLYKCYKVVIN